ncbi:MAG: YlbF family regulator [Pedosphaera sp.]|nr:YlbF family regulator [Pedosphaera sp.]MSU42656.1 YlbF family regulator [Pedosphaera sp.]
MDTTLNLEPIAQQTNELCRAIIDQPEFVGLHKRIESFLSDEKLKFEYQTLNERGALLQQKQQYGVELKPEEVAEFETLRTEFLANPVAKGFLEAQEEVQQVQDRIHQHLAKAFELGRVPQSGDFDFCSDGFGHCGCK